MDKSSPGLFLPRPARDASGVIRGFVYQVDRTLISWMDLDPAIELACEYAEDLDHVRRGVEANGSTSTNEHFLEQVKYRQDARFSLKSSAVLEALGNFLSCAVITPQSRSSTASSPTHPLRLNGGRPAPATEPASMLGMLSASHPPTRANATRFRRG